jgi:transcriptional regulator with XRE-family HTH domain
MKDDLHPLTAYRERHGLSQMDLARRLGVRGSGTISKWENGQVPAERVLDIARLTGIPPHRLRPDIYPQRLVRVA